MNNVNKLMIRFVIVSFMMTSCIFPHDDENRHSVIEMNNYSDKAIYVNIDAEYPDTSGRFIGDFDPFFKISSHNKNSDILYMRYGWESFLRDKRQLPSDTLMIFMMDADIVELHTNFKKAIIQRYDISLQDLQRLNWMLTYPPSESMKNVKMWPPYGSSIKYQ